MIQYVDRPVVEYREDPNSVANNILYFHESIPFTLGNVMPRALASSSSGKMLTAAPGAKTNNFLRCIGPGDFHISYSVVVTSGTFSAQISTRTLKRYSQDGYVTLTSPVPTISKVLKNNQHISTWSHDYQFSLATGERVSMNYGLDGPDQPLWGSSITDITVDLIAVRNPTVGVPSFTPILTGREEASAIAPDTLEGEDANIPPVVAGPVATSADQSLTYQINGGDVLGSLEFTPVCPIFDETRNRFFNSTNDTVHFYFSYRARSDTFYNNFGAEGWTLSGGCTIQGYRGALRYYEDVTDWFFCGTIVPQGVMSYPPTFTGGCGYLITRLGSPYDGSGF